ncbi:MAG: glycosyltransferase, partial [Thermomicrobiales bacterium]
GERVILCTDPRFSSASMATQAQAHGLVSPDGFLLTGRLDDDDAWERETVAQVRAAAARWLAQPDRREVLGMTFPLGLEWVMYDVVDVEVSAARGAEVVRAGGVRAFPRLFHGDSVFVLSAAGLGYTCISANHTNIHDYLLQLPADVEIIDTGRPMWLYTRHKQVSTGIQHEYTPPLPLTTSDLAASFGIDQAGVDAYIHQASEYDYLLEKKTQHRRDVARKTLRLLDDQAAAGGLTLEQQAEREELATLIERLTSGLTGAPQHAPATTTPPPGPAAPAMLIATRYGQGITDERWFSHREQVLGNITAPSLLAQTDPNFRWAIYIDEDMPPAARAALERMTAPFGERVLFVTNTIFTNESMGELARQHGLVSPDGWMLTGRIDDDDAWERETVAQVRAAAAVWLTQPDRHDILGMTFPLGLEWIMYDTYDVDVRDRKNRDVVRTAGVRTFPRLFHGDSVFVLSPAVQHTTCLAANHGKIHAYLQQLPADVEVIDTGRPMWLYTRHKQVSTNIQHEMSEPLPLATADLAASFGIDAAGVDAYIASADDYAYLLEKRTQHRRNAANAALQHLAMLACAGSLTEEQEAERRDLQDELTRLTSNLLGDAVPISAGAPPAAAPDALETTPEQDDPEAHASTEPDAPGRLPAGVDSAVTRARENLARALQDLAGAELPPDAADSFAMDPPALALLSHLVRRSRPRHVLEFGSGASTVVIAQALQGSSGRLTSIDHDSAYARRTVAALAGNDPEHRARVVVAPLVARSILGRQAPVYALRTQDLASPLPADLILIDGPPQALGGRTGTLLQAVGLAAPGAILLLDDAARAAEQEALQTLETSLGDAVEIVPLEGFPRGLTALIIRSEPVPQPGADLPDLRSLGITGSMEPEALAGPPTPQHPGARSATRSRGRPAVPVLFMSSNGAGMGHLMRLLAMARRAAPAVQPFFFTLSAAVECVRQEGWPVEHMASREYAGEPPGPWNAELALRLKRLLSATRPAAVVFDGAFPYNGLVQARRDHPEMAFVWSRRGMWRANAPTGGLALARHFDLVIEPGDVAAAADTGPTAACVAGVTRVDPVLLLDPGDLLDRAEARHRLGLQAEGPVALVQLGAGNINDTQSLTRIVIDLLGQWPGLQICVATPPIAKLPPELPPGVKPLSLFPLVAYAHAFDFGVAAAGYNTVNEAVMAGLPQIFIPNLHTRMDDQRVRGAYAAAQGFGLCVEDPTPRALAAAVATIHDPACRAEMRRRALERPLPNGARAAMAAVEALVPELVLAGGGKA